MPLLEIELFGPDVRVRSSGSPLAGSLAPKTRALLAYLVLRRFDHSPRERIAAALWPDALEADARKNLRRHLSLLTQTLPQSATPWFETQGGGLRMNRSTDVRVDVWDFERLGVSPVSRPAAVALYTGDLLELSGEDWLEPLRDRLRGTAIGWLCSLFDAHERYDPDAALRYGARVLDIDPLREDLLRRMMLVRAGGGNPAGALRDYGEFADRLRRELDVAPAAETIALAESLRSDQPHRGAPATNGRASHGDATRGPFATAFVGRASESAEIADLLAAKRLVTIVGVGGLGKSRLGRHVAARLEERTGIAVHTLAIPSSATESALIAMIASTLDVAMPSGDDAVRELAEHLSDREILFVLDSCESERDAVRRLCDDVLEACPTVRILATSRMPLGSKAETLFRLGPLAFADRDEPAQGILGSDAAALFLDRSRAFSDASELGDDEREALGEICRRLGGIPLAIELAAARRRVLGIVEIAERLGDARFDRQHTVREAIAWSYGALAEPERRLFCALGVFESPFGIDAAAHVARSLSPAPAVIESLSSLIDRSLVVISPGPSETRYRMLDPIREFAHETLLASEFAPNVYRSAVAFYMEFCDRHGLPEGEPAPRRAFEAVASEHRNIHGILRQTAELADRMESPAALVERMTIFWQLRGHVSDARTCVDSLLAGSWPLDEFQANRCTLALEASTFARLEGDFEVARRRIAEARDLAGGLARADLLAEADFAEAVLDFGAVASPEARARFERCAASFEKLGDSARVGRCRANVAVLYLNEREYDRAADAMREAIRLLRGTGRRRWLATAIGTMGYVERYRKNFDEATAYSREAFVEGERTADRVMSSNALANLAFVATSRGEVEHAVQYLRSGFEAATQVRLLFCILSLLETSTRLFIEQGRFDDAASIFAIFSALIDRYEVVRGLEDRELAAALEAIITKNTSELTLLRRRAHYQDASLAYASRIALDVLPAN